jgi:phage terminase large subunit-like protein
MSFAPTDKQQGPERHSIQVDKGVNEGDAQSVSALFESSSCVLPIKGPWCVKSRSDFPLQVL